MLAGVLAAGNWPAWRGEGSNGAATGKQPPLDLAGKLLWKVELPGRGCSTPIVWNDKLFVTSPIGDQDGLLAFDAKGKELWRKTFGANTPGRGQRVGSSTNSSPILRDGKFYVLKDGGPQRGRLTCLDAKSGGKLWESSLPKAPQVYYSSPLLVGDQIYCVREDGMIFSGKITKDGLSDIKSHALEEGVIASPISVGGRLIVRTDSSLFCFGED